MGKKQNQKPQPEANPNNIDQDHANSDEELERQRRNFEKLQILRGEDISHSDKKNLREEMIEGNSEERPMMDLEEEFSIVRGGGVEE